MTCLERMWSCQKVCPKFLVQMLHESQMWRRPALSANRSKTGSYSLLFPTNIQSQIPSHTSLTQQKSPVWTGSKTSLHSVRVTLGDRSIIIPPGPVLIFEVWDSRGPGWGNGCSHPAFQKDGSELEMNAAYTVWEKGIFMVQKPVDDITGTTKNNRFKRFMSPKGWENIHKYLIAFNTKCLCELKQLLGHNLTEKKKNLCHINDAIIRFLGSCYDQCDKELIRWVDYTQLLENLKITQLKIPPPENRKPVQTTIVISDVGVGISSKHCNSDFFWNVIKGICIQTNCQDKLWIQSLDSWRANLCRLQIVSTVKTPWTDVRVLLDSAHLHVWKKHEAMEGRALDINWCLREPIVVNVQHTLSARFD